MLKEAADCCGIVPDLPPGPPPPVANCYWYTKVHDNSCTFFNPGSATWTLNGIDVISGSWPFIMQNPPYGTQGNAVQYVDPFSGCGSFNPSDFYFWTMVPSTVLTLPDLTGNDYNGNPVSYPMIGPICDRKCYEGSFISVSGSSIVWGFSTAEINASEISLFVDLLSPTVNDDLTGQLRQYYPYPPLSATVNILRPGEYTIRISGVYSLGTEFYVYLDDGVTVGTLNEIPC